MTATDPSPEFSPSILHNKKGPMNPSYNRPNATGLASDNALTPFVPFAVNRYLKDKRVMVAICVFLPPLAVFLKAGLSRKFGLSLLLFAFFIIPGIIYGFYVTFLESALNTPDSTNYEV